MPFQNPGNGIISGITDFIFVESVLKRCDVIFLPGSLDPAIPEKGAELYRAGYAPMLIPAGGVSFNRAGVFGGVRSKADIYDGNYQTECEFYTDVLIKNGVPIDAIVGEDESGYTKQNALLTRAVADNRGIMVQSAIIVCKSFHARRCLMSYGLAFPDTELMIAPIDFYGITRENWHTFEYGIERVLGELSRCGSQFVEEIKAAAVH